MSQLPQGVQRRIYLEYLFKDFLHQFSVYLKMNSPILSVKGPSLLSDSKYNKFIVAVCQSLEPRVYKAKKVIQEQYAEVFETFFVMTGRVGCGYRLFNETHFGKVLEAGQVVNDYACTHDKCSEFLYTALTKVTGYGIRKSEFAKLTGHREIGPSFKKWVKDLYMGMLKRPLIDHRAEQSQNYAYRSDYVDVKAFGVAENTLAVEQEALPVESAEDFNLLRMVSVIDDLQRQIAAMAKDYDRRLLQVT